MNLYLCKQGHMITFQYNQEEDHHVIIRQPMLEIENLLLIKSDIFAVNET